MRSPPIPYNEVERVARLRELLVLDTGPEPMFDNIARLASELCGAPIAWISLVDSGRLWLKANVGLPGVQELPRESAFCAHAINGDALFEVPDATLDPRFTDNPLVTGTAGVRFYAGAPLILPGGERIGTLCVLDRRTRPLDTAQADRLRSLAGITIQAMLMRQAMATSEARSRIIVEEFGELVVLVSADGTLIEANPACARMFDLTPARMAGHDLLKHVARHDHDRMATQIVEVSRDGDAPSFECRMRVPSGERWIAWTSQLHVDMASGARLVRLIGRDVTERKHAELALLESQRLLERTGNVAGVGGWVAHLTDGSFAWSDQMRRIHEVDADFHPTLDSVLSFYTPESRALIDGAIREAMTSGKSWDLELRLVTDLDRRIWVRSQGEAEFEGSTAVRLVGALQDITARKRLEQRVANGARFLRQITDSLPLRVAYIDRERRYQFVNLAQEQRFGLSRDAIIGRTRSELTHGVNDEALEPRFTAALSGQEQRFEYEEEVGGELRRLEAHLIPDVSPSGEVAGFYATSIDITERSAAERRLRELTEILDHTTDFVVQTDWRGTVAYMNPAVRRVAGIGPDERVTERHFAEFNTPATQEHFKNIIVPAVRANDVWLGETTVYAAGRRVIPVSHMVIAHRDSNGQVARYSAVMRDISDEVKTRHEILRQTVTLRSVAEAIPAIVGVVGSDRHYRFVNSGFERWVGAKREHIIGRSMADVIGPVDYERNRIWIERALAGESVQFERDYESVGSVKHLVVSYIPLWLDDGSVDGFVAVKQDITQHKQEEVRLRRLSQRDALTGLLNRHGFEQEMESRVQAGEGAHLALLYIDLDHFKPVNDRYGHPMGDQLLRHFGQRMTEIVRPTDAVARLGGDEFAILLGGVREVAHATAVADKVIVAAHTAFDIDGRRLHIGASVGVAFGVDPALGWRDLVARADARLYQAKEAGRGQQAGASRW